MDETLVQIEESQAGLRDSIERARDLAEETERLVSKHRAEASKETEAEPRDQRPRAD